MSLPVRLRIAAEEDLTKHAEFLFKQSEKVAREFLDAFDRTIRLLQDSPYLGGMCSFQNPAFQEMRVWAVAGFKHHLVFYRVMADEVEVIRIIHGSRDITSIFHEEE